MAQLRSLHEKRPFQSSDAVLGEFNKLVGTDRTLVSGFSTFGRMDTAFSFKIGKEQFPVVFSGRMEGGVQNVDCIQFKLATFEDSPYESVTIWEWEMPLMGSDQTKKAEQGAAPQSAPRAESKPEGSHKPQPEPEARSR